MANSYLLPPQQRYKHIYLHYFIGAFEAVTEYHIIGASGVFGACVEVVAVPVYAIVVVPIRFAMKDHLPPAVVYPKVVVVFADYLNVVGIVYPITVIGVYIGDFY